MGAPLGKSMRVTKQGASPTTMWAPDFAWWATLPGAKPAVAGRFGYQRGGVVLAGGWDWNSVPMALATWGTATVTNNGAGNFPLYAR